MLPVLLVHGEIVALVENCMVCVQQKQEPTIQLAVAAQWVIHTVLGHPVTGVQYVAV